MLKKKDVFILEVIYKVVLASVRQLAILAGKKEISTARKAVNKLIKNGFVKSFRMGDHLVYSLTQKGITEIEKRGRPYEVKGFSSEHIEVITSAACWLYITRNCSVMDMAFDMEIARQKLDHSPDIMIGNPASCIEAELTPKSLSRLAKNVQKNAEKFEKQIWIVPARLKVLQKHLRDLAKENQADLEILSVEEISTEIEIFDLKSNTPKMNPIIGVPAPIQRRKEVRLHD